MSSEAQKRASTAYNQKQDNIMIRPDKETGAKIRAAAAAAGQSVQRFIIDTVMSRIESDQRPAEVKSKPAAPTVTYNGMQHTVKRDPETAQRLAQFMNAAGLPYNAPEAAAERPALPAVAEGIVEPAPSKEQLAEAARAAAAANGVELHNAEE